MADRRFRLAGRRIDALYQWAEENAIDLSVPLDDVTRNTAQQLLDQWKLEDHALLKELRDKRNA